MISGTLQNYYNVSLRCGIGIPVQTPGTICDSYQYARQIFQNTESHDAIVAFDTGHSQEKAKNSFNISLFKNDLTRAFEEYDPDILHNTIQSICDLFRDHPGHYVQALDAASNILYLSISLLQDGESIVSGFFAEDPDGYRSLYKQSNVDHVIQWLQFFCGQLCELFQSRRKDYKNHIVTNVRKYINEHVSERLSLNEVAAVFGISPNYLSQLFSKYNDTGFSEYINICKITEAKRLLEEENMKVYEPQRLWASRVPSISARYLKRKPVKIPRIIRGNLLYKGEDHMLYQKKSKIYKRLLLMVLSAIMICVVLCSGAVYLYLKPLIENSLVEKNRTMILKMAEQVSNSLEEISMYARNITFDETVQASFYQKSQRRRAVTDTIRSFRHWRKS